MSRDFEVNAPYDETKVTALADLDSGSFLSSGGINGIVLGDWSTGDEITLVHRAAKVTTHVKKAGEDWLAGDRLYYDAIQNEITKFEQVKFAGYALENATTLSTTADFILEGLLTPDSFKSTSETFLTRKLIQSEADLPAPILDKIHLENFQYLFDGPVTIDHTLVFPSTGGCCLGGTCLGGISLLTITGTGNAFEGTLGATSEIIFNGLEVACPTRTLFNVTGTAGIIAAQNSKVFGAVAGGTINGVSFKPENFLCLFFGGGFELTGVAGNIIDIGGMTCTGWANSGATMLKFSGTYSSMKILNSNFDPQSTEYAFDFTAGLTIAIGAVINECTVLANAFAPTSRDQTDKFLDFQDNPGVIRNSMFLGSAFMNGNLTPTNLTVQADNGDITGFADAGGGQTTVTTALAHGLNNGDDVYIIASPTYGDKYTVSNVTATTFEITATFTTTEVAYWETGWEKIGGTLIAGSQNERFVLIGNKTLKAANLTTRAISNQLNMAGITGNAAAKNYEVAVFKNLTRETREAKTPVALKNISAPIAFIDNNDGSTDDEFDIMIRTLDTPIEVPTVSNVQWINK